MATNITPLEAFDCEGDPSSMCTRWEKWKRGLKIYLEAADIDDAIRKRAILLHTGGMTLQEIYYNIPGAHILDEDSDEAAKFDVYEVALEKLNEYFAPKQSRVFERHLFRLTKQEPGEKFENFLVRLRKQADKCAFKDQVVKEESLIDQIVEKCSSNELRKKILKEGDSFKLQDIVAEANALESVKRQLNDFEGKNTSETINKVTSKDQKLKVATNQSREPKRPSNCPCSRCGCSKHTSNDPQCPALNATCHKCGFRGHFMKNCRSRRQKRAAPPSADLPPAKKSKKSEEKVHCVSDKIEYIFHIDDDSVIQCTLGGVTVDLLIDSGSKCNLLTEGTWERLKLSKIKVYDQSRSPEKVFLPYGSKKPLVILGSFKTVVEVANKAETATFYVIKDGTKDLLGKDTSVGMGLLHIGLQESPNSA